MSKNTDTTNTQGLDALAALCGFTAEASENNASSAAQPSAMNSAPEVGQPAPTNNGASNLQMLLQLQALNSAAQRAQQQQPQSAAGLPPQIMMALQAAAEQQQAIVPRAMPPPPKVVPPLKKTSKESKSKKRSSAGKKTKESSSPPSKRPKAAAKAAAAAAKAEAPVEDVITDWEDKKQAKRAANRISATLSRKRKKMAIENLKDENAELRRKENILRSIPDLIVVFDSGGCISFVSRSFTHFLDYTVEELENTSFWDQLTEDSVRLIKSSFMDALAVKRAPDEDSTPLAAGESITIKMLPKDGTGSGGEGDDSISVSLKGVVHFEGESPECVCSIRPEDAVGSPPVNKTMKPAAKEVASYAARGQQAAAGISDYESQYSRISD